MCDKDILFCVFYYLGYIAIAAALTAGIFIFIDWIKSRKEKEQEE